MNENCRSETLDTQIKLQVVKASEEEFPDCCWPSLVAFVAVVVAVAAAYA